MNIEDVFYLRPVHIIERPFQLLFFWWGYDALKSLALLQGLLIGNMKGRLTYLPDRE